MAQFPDCLFIVTVEVDAEVEAAWNRWYDEVHLPDALACPGVLHGRRYVSAGDATSMDRGQRGAAARKTYVTVYELAGPEALRTPAFLAMRGWHDFAPRVASRSQVFLALADQRSAA